MPWWWTFGSVPELPPAQILEISEAGNAQIVDNRTTGEFLNGHIKGAVSCPLNPPWSFERRLRALNLDPSKPVYPICLSAHRSIAGQRKLTSMGFTAFQLQGGMQKWRECKYPEVQE
eukprot:TRINITY_DN85170_c0_g1_i1.p1 TRINITY_DN85170_c0_g1~~TRINITY_DN85170_c0_g1_i1.p1  ORF type:complete len:117 (+),score=6.50 TRINITY_DN85170_c0_g1_i1:91-441(+)